MADLKQMTPAAMKRLREAFGGDWTEDDYNGERWFFAPALMVRRGPASSRRRQDGGLRDRLIPGVAVVALSITEAARAKRARLTRGNGHVKMGGRRFDADYVALIEGAYRVSEWRVSPRIAQGPYHRAYTADRLAFAYVEGREAPVASLAPWRRGS